MLWIPQYDPWTDAEENWSDWTIRLENLHGMGEMFDLDLKIAIGDPTKAGERRAMMHLLAHLELGHHLTPGAKFTDDQERQAEMLTDLRLWNSPGDMLEDQEATRRMPRFRG